MAGGGASHAIDLSPTSGTSASLSVKSWKQMRFGATVRQQYDFSCGSAALATLLTHHYNYPVTEALVFEAMFLQGDQQKIRQQGFSLLDMQRFLLQRGFHADGFELPLEKLVEAKLPAIVLISDQGYNHFVVLKGIADGRVLLGDPATGARSVSVARFRELWRNKLLFVIHGYQGTVAFNGAPDWRAAPAAPLGQALDATALAALTLPKFGPGDF
ncbi:MAG: peptidase [Massilia sp.]|nr:peptidase [Massilia sp.]